MTLKEQQIARDKDIAEFTIHKEDIRVAANQAKTTMADAASLAAKAIAEAAGQAKVAIAEAAAVSVKVLNVKNADDHDLLIELKVGNQFIRDDIKNLSSGVTAQIDELQRTKANKKDLDDLYEEIHVVREKRMRSLEDKTFNVWIALGFVMLGVAALFTIVTMHVFK